MSDAWEAFEAALQSALEWNYRNMFDPAGEVPGVLAGEVLESDGEEWRVVNVAGFPVTDRRRLDWRPPVSWRKNLEDHS